MQKQQELIMKMRRIRKAAEMGQEADEVSVNARKAPEELTEAEVVRRTNPHLP